MSRRLKPTLADYVVLAINPVLIMGLVGSLIYFLLEILYGGAYPDRLQFCLSMFVFAIVLISRISMEEGFERAAPFGIALALVVGISLNRYVVYPSPAAASFGWIINWSLMALTWWCAHKLTWDCTTIDDRAEASGRGLLETAGIERSSEDPADKAPPAAIPPAPAEPAAAAPANLPPATELSQKRWQQLLDRPRRPHTPGVWIVYFSLASLPIFGLGQLFIPAEKSASRRYVFLLLCVYVGCGLALLLTTSFLSLRRYLRQRRLEMPAVMAGNWLATGGVMVVALLLFSALLPRPAPEYAISALPDQIRSAEHGASPVSAGGEGVRDPEAGSDSGVDHSQNPPPGQTDPSTAAGADAQHPSTGPDGQTAGKSGSSSSDKGLDKGSSGSAQKAGGQPGEKSPAPSSDNPPSDSPSSEKPTGEKPTGDQSANGEPSRKPTADKSDSKADPQSAAKTQPQTPEAQKTQPQDSSGDSAPPPANPPPPSASPPPASSPPLPNPGSLLGPLSGLFKLALYAALIAGVAYGAWRSRAELREILTGWLTALRNFWRLFFGGGGEISQTAEEIAFHQQQLGWSFSDFVDPFASGAAAKSSPAELVKYTFAALEVWGREQGFPRDTTATPHEFVALLGSKAPALRADALALANLYSRAVYSQSDLPPAAASDLAQLWRLMHSARAQQPVMSQ